MSATRVAILVLINALAVAGCDAQEQGTAGTPAGQSTPSAQPQETPKPPPPPAADRELVLDLGEGVTLKLVRIPAGKFLMGSPKDEPCREDDEGLPRGQWVKGEPRVEVTISKPFYMGVTEVTVAQYERFWKDSGREDRGVLLEKPTFNQGPDHPAVMVTWDDAQAFCEWLSKKTGREVRLPTEAQWEYACRAGTQTAYSFGDDTDKLGDYAWYDKNSDGSTHPVAKKKPNAWGLYDMHGNAWEWCSDYYAEGYPGPGRDPIGPSSGSFRVLRGGSWGSDPRLRLCRSADRSGSAPDDRRNILGFRVVLDLN